MADVLNADQHVEGQVCPAYKIAKIRNVHNVHPLISSVVMKWILDMATYGNWHHVKHAPQMRHVSNLRAVLCCVGPNLEPFLKSRCVYYIPCIYDRTTIYLCTTYCTTLNTKVVH